MVLVVLDLLRMRANKTLCMLATESFIHMCARQAQQVQLGTYRGNHLSPTSSVSSVCLCSNRVLTIQVTAASLIDLLR